VADRLYEQEKYRQAIASYEEAMARAPEGNRKERKAKANIWASKGNTLDALGEYEDALEAYDQSIQLNDREAYVWRNRADLLYDDLKRFDDARRAAEQALFLEPDNVRGWMLKGLALRAGGHEAEAREAFMTAVTKNQADFFGCYSHGVAWFELGQYGNALQAIDAALKLNDGDKDAWALRAKALRALGRLGEAQRAEQRAKTSKDRM